MQVYINGKRMDSMPEAFVENDAVVVLAGYDESEKILQALSFDTLSDPVNDLRSSTHYESHKGYDFFYINKPSLSFGGQDSCTASGFYNAKRLAVFTDNLHLTDALVALFEKKPENVVPILVVFKFFGALSGNDSLALEDIEDRLTQMESRLVEEDDEEIMPELLQVRRKLLVLKRYYEALFDLLQDMEENTEGYFNKQQLTRLRIYTNKADRLYNLVNNLREYATQVREAYQNQIDIKQNQIMKLFTVITAIFLPLTLIAGWYGMNLQMPEYEHAITYPVVIGVSACIVILMLSYFKRKNWF